MISLTKMTILCRIIIRFDESLYTQNWSASESLGGTRASPCTSAPASLHVTIRFTVWYVTPFSLVDRHQEHVAFIFGLE